MFKQGNIRTMTGFVSNSLISSSSSVLDANGGAPKRHSVRKEDIKEQ